jgi:phenylpropionate dioxygenase-like ring-hydroxylating dioxygenase large terminal subunit
VAADGKVARVPAATNCPLEGQHCVNTYPVQELQGGVFLWFGDALHADPAPLQLPDELTSPEWTSMLCTAAWACNYRYAVENVMDPMHGAYLHAASHSMAEGDKTAVMRIRKTQFGLMFEKEGQRDVNFDWTEWGDTGAQWMRLSIPYRKDAGPGGPFFIIGFVTPVDEGHCRVFFWRCRKVQGWQRGVWRFMYRNRLEGLHWDVLEQDRVILENMAADAREHEFLYQHDTGMAHVRRLIQKEAEAQAAALAGRAAAE